MRKAESSTTRSASVVSTTASRAIGQWSFTARSISAHTDKRHFCQPERQLEAAGSPEGVSLGTRILLAKSSVLHPL